MLVSSSLVLLQIPSDFVNFYAVICVCRHGEEFLFGNITDASGVDALTFFYKELLLAAAHDIDIAGKISGYKIAHALTFFYKELLLAAAHDIDITRKISGYKIALVVGADAIDGIHDVGKNPRLAHRIDAHNMIFDSGEDISFVI